MGEPRGVRLTPEMVGGGVRRGLKESWRMMRRAVIVEERLARESV